MKRIYPILIVGLLLLNTAGYYALFVHVQHRHDTTMRLRFDADDYDITQTVTIQIPLAIPYMSGSDDYERVEGKFQHNGEFYRLIKQKYTHDTLTIICIRDQQDKQIHEALSDYVKTFADVPVDGPHPSKLLQLFAKDYIQNTCYLNTLSTGWQADVSQVNFCSGQLLSFHTLIAHPPERA